MKDQLTLRAALERIEAEDDTCHCDHSTIECCFKQNEYCAVCIAHHALAALGAPPDADAAPNRLRELLAASYPYIEWFGGAHDEDCPQDDTCDCETGRINVRLNAAIRAAELATDGAPHVADSAVFPPMERRQSVRPRDTSSSSDFSRSERPESGAASRELEQIVRELKEQCSVGCLYCTVTVESDGIEHHEHDCLVERLSRILAAPSRSTPAPQHLERWRTMYRALAWMINDYIGVNGLSTDFRQKHEALGYAHEGYHNARLVMRENKPPLPERLKRFNDGTGCLYGGNAHPDRCVCQEKEGGLNKGTPHKHYDEPPYGCARCHCKAYEPALPAAFSAVEATPPQAEHLEACRIRMGRGNFSCCCDDLRAEAAERQLKRDRESVFWPPNDEAEEHLYEIRNGINAEYVATHVAALKELWQWLAASSSVITAPTAAPRDAEKGKP